MKSCQTSFKMSADLFRLKCPLSGIRRGGREGRWSIARRSILVRANKAMRIEPRTAWRAAGDELRGYLVVEAIRLVFDGVELAEDDLA